MDYKIFLRMPEWRRGLWLLRARREDRHTLFDSMIAAANLGSKKKLSDMELTILFYRAVKALS